MTTTEKISVFLFLFAVAAVYLLEASLVLVLVYNLAAGRAPAVFVSAPALAIHSLAVIGLFCFAWGFFVEPYRLEVNSVSIKSKKLTAASIRLVHFSDIHCDKTPLNENKLVELVNQLEPDIIAFTGDCLNTTDALDRFKRTMKKLNAKIGKFAVHGNIDTKCYPDLYTDTDFQLLDAKIITLQKNNQNFSITGLSSNNTSVSGHVPTAPEGTFNIFLYHKPELIEQMPGKNIDLYLCGHTHGGQVALPFFGALVTCSKFGKKYEAGLYNVGSTKMYVNRGVGCDGGYLPRVRFCARPEITVFDITPQSPLPVV